MDHVKKGKRMLDTPELLICVFPVDMASYNKEGDQIVFFMDHNEHVINGPLGKALANKEGPDLREAIVHHTGTSLGAMFFQGTLPINGLWVSGDLDVSNACVVPFGYCIGDHRAFILDIPLESLVGVDPVKIVRPAG